jgi:HlyD family secretion protein
MSLLGAAAVLLALSGCARKHTGTYQGYVEGKYVYIASSQSGRLMHLAVARGDTIQTDHPLFQLEVEPERSAERQARQLLQEEEARLADLKTGKRPPEVDVTRAQLEQARAGQKKSIDLLQSYEKQYAAGGIPLTDLITARAAVDADNAAVRQLQSELMVDALPAREQQIKAQAQRVAANRAALEQATWRLQQKQVASPRNGLVFDTLYREGEWIAPGNPVIQLLPPEDIELRFFVPEALLGKLRVGQQLSVHGDGWSVDIPARITFISAQAEYTPPVIYSNETRSKLVFLVIAKPPVDEAAALHPGQPIEVTLR